MNNTTKKTQADYEHKKGETFAYEKWTNKVEYALYSDVDGFICNCIDKFDLKDTIKSFKVEDKRDPERKGKVNYYWEEIEVENDEDEEE